MDHVKVGMLPGKIVEVQYDGQQEMKIADALAASGLGDVTGYDIRVNGAESNLDATLRPGDMVIFARQVKGN